MKFDFLLFSILNYFTLGVTLHLIPPFGRVIISAITGYSSVFLVAVKSKFLKIAEITIFSDKSAN